MKIGSRTKHFIPFLKCLHYIEHVTTDKLETRTNIQQETWDPHNYIEMISNP